MDEALAEFRDLLKGLKDSDATPDADSLQTKAFQVSKDRNLKMKDWFRMLYRVFLGQSQGPRIGSFIALLGFEKTIERLNAHLEGHE
jgi:lysyl-tRNA synthetase class 1